MGLYLFIQLFWAPCIRVSIIGLPFDFFHFKDSLNFYRISTFCFYWQCFILWACKNLEWRIFLELFHHHWGNPVEPLQWIPFLIFLLHMVTRNGGVWIGWVCLPPILPAFFIYGTVLNSMLGSFLTNLSFVPPTYGRSILIKALTSTSISTPFTSIESPSPCQGTLIPLVSRVHIISRWDRLWWPILL